MLRLVKFDAAFIPQLMDMMDEWTAAGEKIVPWAIRKCDYHDIERYAASLEVKTADENHVPDSTFFCLDTAQDRFVGAVNIRHSLNEALLFSGGHIGDGIRPSARNQGFGTQMVALALNECDQLGIRRVLMCCSKRNLASARTIQKNGGILENEVSDGGEIVQRYWIERTP